MIGSVHERRREIQVYTSVGLAPSHILILFMAEAMAFAVISIVLGYLVAQSLAFLFAGTSIWSQMTVNYSSLASVASMTLVLLVTLLSSLYPGRMAARIAIPDVNQTFSIPPSQNQTMETPLPFLLKKHELSHLGDHLHTWLEDHSDTPHESFRTSDISMTDQCKERSSGRFSCENDASCNREACLSLSAKIWLAPYDFGVRQHLTLDIRPFPEDKMYLNLTLKIRRETGEADLWRRLNKAFINTTRKQLLLWRSMK